MIYMINNKLENNIINTTIYIQTEKYHLKIIYTYIFNNI